MRSFLFIFFTGFTIAFGTLSINAAEQGFAPAASLRATYNFNPGWKLLVGDPADVQRPGFDDSGWKPVTLPHAWNEDTAFRVPIAEHPTGIAWYRKHFKLPADASGKKVFLEFEGVRQAGEFYLNGKFIGRHENGVMAVGLDATDFVLSAPAENVLAVRTDNSWDYREKASGQRFQWNDRNFNANFGGIPKNVKLHIAGRLYQTLPLYSNLGTVGIYIYAEDFDVAHQSATITAESQVRNETTNECAFSHEVVVEDLEGNLVKRFESGGHTLGAGETGTVKASARVEGLQFWSWGYGYLYNVYTLLKVDGRVVDAVRKRTGFRKTEFGHGMVRLNDRPMQIKGYAQRTSNEWPALGMSVPPWLSDFSNQLMVEDNANLVRWMHVTPWKQDVESCDRVGLCESMPAGDSEGDVTGRRWEQRLDLMRDAIVYNRNNPSILFYESGNKGISEEHLRQMKALRDQYDPHGGRAIGARETLGSQVAEYGGEMLYVNKSARNPLWAMEYCRDEGLRKYWDEFSPPFHKDGDGPLYRGAPAKEYNRNQDSFAIEAVARWHDYWRERPGSGERVNAGGVNIIFSDSNTHFRGAENYRRSGEVDAMRIPKDAYWAHAVMWDGWVDVEHPRMHILGHWNYGGAGAASADGEKLNGARPSSGAAGFEAQPAAQISGDPTPTRPAASEDGRTPVKADAFGAGAALKKSVYVVSSAEAVELFLNGKSLGKGAQTNRFLFTFENVVWRPGQLRAVGYDARGNPVCVAAMETTGDPAALQLTALTGPGGLKADGADVALVQVEVVDSEGRRCPTALNTVAFSLSGPAEWRGGIAQGPDNFILAKSLPVECGVNRVLVRSSTEAGKIVISAESPGLEPASTEIISQSIGQVGPVGLAGYFPNEGLASCLLRGPTPSGPAYKITRQPVLIARATAGSNADRAAASFDDNETTSWSSDGKPGTAWISYEFARPATVTEATLKLTGWRTRSYPIRITLDGQEVFRGATPRSLGYVTLPLRPVHGQTLKIELISGSATGAQSIAQREPDQLASQSNALRSTNQQAFAMTELTDEKNASAGDQRLARGALSIVEVEFYESLGQEH